MPLQCSLNMLEGDTGYASLLAPFMLFIILLLQCLIEVLVKKEHGTLGLMKWICNLSKRSELSSFRL